jgi:NodT family efflux transporter outer membrane factor (OMF) lipoprotein
MDGIGKRKQTPGWVFLVLAAFMAVEAGCAAVGPDYSKPVARLPGRWNTELANGLGAKPVDPSELESWWRGLGDPILSDLVERAVRTNPDLKKAKSRVIEACARRDISRADLFSSVDAVGSYQKSHRSKDAGAETEEDLQAVGLDAVWELDIFGGVRRSVEAARGELRAGWEDLRDVLVSLVAEVGLSYVDTRTYQMRLGLAEKNLATQQETLRLTQFRCQAGLTTELAVQQARYDLENTRSQIPSLRAGLEESKNRIAVLLGEPPGAVHALMDEPTPIPVAPPEVAVGVPADILRQRPDVRRAERELAAQTARVGAAVAELYPKLTLNGSIGLDALSLAGLFTASNRSFNFGPSISFPLFRGGAIRGNIKVQSALQEQALIAYESSILNGVEEVENALVAYAREQERRRSLAEASDAAREAAALAENQFQAGQIDFSSVLDAQRSLLSFEDQLAQSSGKVTSNLIRLYKALGGGWTPLSPQTSPASGNNQENQDEKV